MPKTNNRAVILTSQSVAAGSTVRGRVDLSGADAGIVTFRITNGATGPTVQCAGRVLIAHAATMPAAAAEGVGDGDWKQVAEISGGTTANASTRGVYEFGPAVQYIEVEFTGHTVQPVTVEAHVTHVAY